MVQIRKFPYIPVKIPRYRILKRLGYHSKKIEIPDEMMNEIDGYIDEAATIVTLKAVCLRSGVELDESAGSVRIIETDTVFESKKLCSFLSGSEQVLIMGITGGRAIATEISRLQLNKKMTAAVVIDASASEIVDDGFDWLGSLFTGELVREGRRLTTRRFSAGYGDFDICFQQDIYRMLKLDELDIEITESSILLPEKSVTAIYGILPAAE